jgi:hypothetical protein
MKRLRWKEQGHDGSTHDFKRDAPSSDLGTGILAHTIVLYLLLVAAYLIP